MRGVDIDPMSVLGEQIAVFAGRVEAGPQPDQVASPHHRAQGGHGLPRAQKLVAGSDQIVGVLFEALHAVDDRGRRQRDGVWTTRSRQELGRGPSACGERHVQEGSVSVAHLDD